MVFVIQPSLSLSGFVNLRSTAVSCLMVALLLLSPAGATFADEMAYDGTIMTVNWENMKKRFLHEYPVVMDDRILLIAPGDAEDQFNVPVTVDARALDNVRKIVVFADLSPIPEILTLEPKNAEPYISFRFKMEQATPVRAAVLTDENRWHVSSTLIDAAGGGCTAPAMAHNRPDWVSTLGQTRARVWPNPEGASRLRLSVRHPMDTGLAAGIPAFHIKTLTIKDANGESLAVLEMHEPISENPAFTLFPKIDNDSTNIFLDTRDIEGNEFSVAVPVTS